MDKDRRTQIRELIDRDPHSMKLIVLLREDGKSDMWHAFWYLVGTVAVFFVPFILQGSTQRPVVFLLAQAVVVARWSVRAWSYLWHGYHGLYLAYLAFYGRLLEYQLDREAIAVEKPSIRYILFKDVQAYEDELRSYVRHYRRNLDRWIREERWVEAGGRLTKSLEALLERFTLEPQEKVAILDKWAVILNPASKKKYLAMLESRLGHEQFMSRLSVVPLGPDDLDREGEFDVVGDPDIRVASLNNQAVNVAREDSRRLVAAAALEPNRREKIRLLKQAIRLDEQAQHSLAVPTSTVVAAESERQTAAVRFLSIQDLARERLNFANLVSPRVNQTMIREIILALLAPGKSGRRFQAAYRAEDTLRVMVRRQYEVYLRKQFNPKVFQDNLAWLVRDGVLFTKPKTDERVYSLSSKTRGKSIEAQYVIRAFLNFDRSLHVV